MVDSGCKMDRDEVLMIAKRVSSHTPTTTSVDEK
jgi:hypothetical protein